MKALILSAGLGTRLRPLTNKMPKALAQIGSKPLLEIHLDLLIKYKVSDILINTHYLADQINKFLDKYKLKNGKTNIKTTYEKILLGSAGTLKQNQDFFTDDENFIITYGDNLTNINYQKLIDYHKQKGGICTVTAYYENHPETKGVITSDEKNKILSFIEKPKPNKITSNYANAGIYICNKKIFEYLNKVNKIPLDFGFDLFPALLKSDEKMYLYKMTEFLLDIGTPETYNIAQKKVKNLIF